MTRSKILRLFFLPGLLCCGALVNADAATYTGTFASDATVYSIPITTTTTQVYDFYTTSYAGGTNSNGTTTVAGGFDPVLTLFSSTGTVIGTSGGGGLAACGGSIKADGTTGLCNDANFLETLKAGSYTLDLTEFPNVAIGMLADGFFLSIDPTAISDACGSSSKFLESDVAPCVQRTGNFAVNVTSAAVPSVPEPSTWLLVLPAFAAMFIYHRRQLA